MPTRPHPDNTSSTDNEIWHEFSVYFVSQQESAARKQTQAKSRKKEEEGLVRVLKVREKCLSFGGSP